MSVVFADRIDAGEQLAARVAHLAGPTAVVLGLPRGGVPVAARVARALPAPLDVIVVRKLGAPGQPELALGAIGEDGVRVINANLVERLDIGEARLAKAEGVARRELERRARLYRAGRPRIPLDGRTALVVDDGVATGATARAACRVARALGAERVVLAVPVAPLGWSPGEDADEFVTLAAPADFGAVGRWYRDFSQTTDEEVIAHFSETATYVDPDTVAPARGERRANVILTGFMGTGKTSVGRQLATRLGYEWVDTDALIGERHGAIEEIFATHGEEAFRNLERLIAGELAGRDRQVISSGGKMMLDPESAAILSYTGTVLCLTATPAAIIARLDADDVDRPLLAGHDPEDRIRQLLAERAAGYSRFTQIDTTDLRPSEVVDAIVALLQ